MIYLRFAAVAALEIDGSIVWQNARPCALRTSSKGDNPLHPRGGSVEICAFVDICVDCPGSEAVAAKSDETRVLISISADPFNYRLQIGPQPFGLHHRFPWKSPFVLRKSLSLLVSLSQ
jgi:hypothetical protein